MVDSPSDKLAAAEFANAPILGPGHDFASVTDKISSIVLSRRTPTWWIAGFLISFALVILLMVSVSYLLVLGVGVWGITIPIGWGFAIINFVWWIGIGHAGTLISAILLLLRQQWRTSINRFAEAMTLFAVSCAGIFPLIHMGRPWLGYWLFPYPDTMKMWPNFRSPLVWDAFSALLVHRLDPGPRHAAGSREKPPGQTDLWTAGDGMARLGGALGAPRNGVLAAGRTRNTARSFRAHHRQF
jgi:hypothetical protein